jgi:hypothetical protein
MGPAFMRLLGWLLFLPSVRPAHASLLVLQSGVVTRCLVHGIVEDAMWSVQDLSLSRRCDEVHDGLEDATGSVEDAMRCMIVWKM